MSSLKNYRYQLTDETNQGIFDNDEYLLSIGRVYAADSTENAFGAVAVVDFVIENPTEVLGVNYIDTVATSEKFKMEFFANPVFTEGTAIPTVNQNVGSANTANFNILLNPVISDPGVLGSAIIVRGSVEGNGSSRAGAGGITDINKRVLQPGIPLLVRVTNQGIAGQLDMYTRIGEFPLEVSNENFRQEFLPEVNN